MEKALKIQRGKEQLVSANEIHSEFHGRNPRGISFICPLCRQPLFPAAMSSGSRQSPHFRHERNNERAHECELYANSYGYFTTYQRAPMPMFIRKSPSREGVFVVEGGFRSLGQRDFYVLVREGAKIEIGQTSYSINAQRFRTGLTKFPFEDISLSCGSSVRLVGSSLDLGSTWGYPEDAHNAMVFTRDSDTEQGKRLKIGDTIPFGTDLFLLAPESEGDRIRSSFTNARKVGIAGKRTAMSNLTVFEISFSKEDTRWTRGKHYLETCGFEVDDSGDTPELLWPPSLMSGGELLPLFEGSRCIFAADMNSSVDNSLYVHTNADTSDRVKTAPLRKIDGGNSGFAILRSTAKLSFVTTRNWVFSSAVLLHPSDMVVDDWLHKLDLEPQISLNKGRWVLNLSYPCEVVSYQKGRSVRVIGITKDQNSYSFEDGCLNALKVRKKLGASLDYLIVFEKTLDSGQPSIGDSAKTAAAGGAISPGTPDDVAFAIARQSGKKIRQRDADRQRALRRKTEGQA